MTPEITPLSTLATINELLPDTWRPQDLITALGIEATSGKGVNKDALSLLCDVGASIRDCETAGWVTWNVTPLACVKEWRITELGREQLS